MPVFFRRAKKLVSDTNAQVNVRGEELGAFLRLAHAMLEDVMEAVDEIKDGVTVSFSLEAETGKGLRELLRTARLKMRIELEEEHDQA